MLNSECDVFRFYWFFPFLLKNVKCAHKTTKAAASPALLLFTDAEDSPADQEGRKDVVLIDSLFIMDQFKAAERMSVGKPHTKDIAEVTAAAEAILPKGSARISTAVRRCAAGRAGCLPPPRRPSAAGTAASGFAFLSSGALLSGFPVASRVADWTSLCRTCSVITLRHAHWAVCHCR